MNITEKIAENIAGDGEHCLSPNYQDETKKLLQIEYLNLTFDFELRYKIEEHTTHLKDPDCFFTDVDEILIDCTFLNCWDNEGDEIYLSKESINNLEEAIK